MKHKQLSLFGLKFNPFTSEVPVSSLWRNQKIENFCFCVEQQSRNGGFALVLGEPGSGKSAVLRILQQRLSDIPEANLAIITRPQSSLADFYRELGDMFNVPLSPSNRWGGTKALRLKWKQHIDTVLYRPIIIFDEAQESSTTLLNELRLLSSCDLDSRNMLSVILAGDSRLTDKLHTTDLLPLASRIRIKLAMQKSSHQELMTCLEHLLEQAGSPSLMSKGLKNSICEHAMGNYRTLMNMGHELLNQAILQEKEQIDEKLFLETFNPTPNKTRKRKIS